MKNQNVDVVARRTLMLALLIGLTACSAPAAKAPLAESAPPPSATPVKPPVPIADSPPAAPPAPEPEPIVEAPPAPDPLSIPLLTGEDGEPLPQTEDRPSIDSAPFQRRIALVWEAIVKDDPEIAMPAFFPLVAYEQVKAIAEPAQDWNGRLIKAFRHNVHEYHTSLGEKPAEAEFVGIEINEEKVKWMKPHSEGNSIGYFRITRGKIRYRTAPVDTGPGVEKTLEVTSMISWRGEWFIVHLNGFK